MAIATQAETKSDNKRRALGKGLESLLPSRPKPAVVPSIAADGGTFAVASGKPLEIQLDNIERNPWQTRTRFDEAQLEELAQSIRSTGVVQPILVRQLHGGKFQLIAG